jgi:hypothetical protein
MPVTGTLIKIFFTAHLRAQRPAITENEMRPKPLLTAVIGSRLRELSHSRGNLRQGWQRRAPRAAAEHSRGPPSFDRRGSWETGRTVERVTDRV